MDGVVEWQWELFIFSEILGWVAMSLFLFVRYGLGKWRSSFFFLAAFVVLTLFQSWLGWVVYEATGAISSFQIVVFIFLVYAFTFGLSDFRNVDSYLKKWTVKGEKGLTKPPKRNMDRSHDPIEVARKNRKSWYIHSIVFGGAQIVFWTMFGRYDAPWFHYLTDLSWLQRNSFQMSPYTEPMIYQITIAWGLIFLLDTVVSWSYTLFPEEKK
ncbi:hypothetical protein [Salsuginibacillus kocurii]|uniref:hypothetical protein n=1 Tax=Salsuginibacillus kocurii TaxID=427078 RepID=UPI00036FD70B|nr:hypothetical protein [Salsuginibacillus kocurii]